MSGGPVRLRLDLAYDGTDFAGWAAQPGQRTVEGELSTALSTLLGGTAPRLTVAGRTDAGVHAVGQVAHLDVPAVNADRVAARRLNGLLPPDIRVTAVRPAAAGFDARFAAAGRHYRYRVADPGSPPDPLRRRDTLTWPVPLDVERWNAAAAALVGLHDFAAFCRRREGATTIRTLRSAAATRGADGVLVAGFHADAFCHSMVRSLVGALLACAEGRWPAQRVAALLEHPQRANDVAVAPPHGLTLVAVDYPADPDLGAQVLRAQRRRELPARGDGPVAVTADAAPVRH